MVIFIILGIISFLFVILGSFFAVYAIVNAIKNSNNNKKYGVEVTGIIKNVKEVNQRYKHDNAIYEKHLEIECEYKYEGKIQTSTFKVFNSLDKDKYKVGNQIECRYNTDTKELIDDYNLKFKDNKALYIAIVSMLLLASIGIVYYFTDSVVLYIILVILAIIFWYSSIYYIYGPVFYKKEKGNYIKLSGRVTDYYVKETWDPLYYYYFPEITFRYNGEKKVYLSQRGSEKKLYNIGQQIEVLYDPEKEIVYGQISRIIPIIAYLIPPICGIVALIQFLLR